jgi:hypothetical protein
VQGERGTKLQGAGWSVNHVEKRGWASSTYSSYTLQAGVPDHEGLAAGEDVGEALRHLETARRLGVEQFGAGSRRAAQAELALGEGLAYLGWIAPATRAFSPAPPSS